MAPRLAPRATFSTDLARFGDSNGSSIHVLRFNFLNKNDYRLETFFRPSSLDLAAQGTLSRGYLEHLGATWRPHRPPRAAFSGDLAADLAQGPALLSDSAGSKSDPKNSWSGQDRPKSAQHSPKSATERPKRALRPPVGASRSAPSARKAFD